MVYSSSGKIFSDSLHFSQRPTFSSVIGSVIEELSSKSCSSCTSVGNVDVTASLAQQSKSDHSSASTMKSSSAVTQFGMKLVLAMKHWHLLCHL